MLAEPDVGAPGVERGGEAGLAAPGSVEVVSHHQDVVNVPAIPRTLIQRVCVVEKIGSCTILDKISDTAIRPFLLNFMKTSYLLSSAKTCRRVFSIANRY